MEGGAGIYEPNHEIDDFHASYENLRSPHFRPTVLLAQRRAEIDYAKRAKRNEREKKLGGGDKHSPQRAPTVRSADFALAFPGLVDTLVGFFVMEKTLGRVLHVEGVSTSPSSNSTAIGAMDATILAATAIFSASDLNKLWHSACAELAAIMQRQLEALNKTCASASNDRQGSSRKPTAGDDEEGSGDLTNALERERCRLRLGAEEALAEDSSLVVIVMKDCILQVSEERNQKHMWLSKRENENREFERVHCIVGVECYARNQSSTVAHFLIQHDILCHVFLLSSAEKNSLLSCVAPYAHPTSS